jgi:predicted PurR-regulated permease PerM
MPLLTAMLTAQGDWKHALVLVGWGVVVIHPVDNLLGPVLVGGTLRLHTLFIFFPVIGGIAAFGASGVVLGPVTAAVAVAFVNWRNSLICPSGEEEPLA